MNKRCIENITASSRLVDVATFMKYTGLGRNNAMKFGEEIGCTVRIGRRVLYDLKKRISISIRLQE